jgi:hypothetical protein
MLIEPSEPERTIINPNTLTLYFYIGNERLKHRIRDWLFEGVYLKRYLHIGMGHGPTILSDYNSHGRNLLAIKQTDEDKENKCISV